jgi:hypothetical protein
VKESLIDANFDPEQPETLFYAAVPWEERLKLLAVEYMVPMALSPGAPAGFTAILGDSTLRELNRITENKQQTRPGEGWA